MSIVEKRSIDRFATATLVTALVALALAGCNAVQAVEEEHYQASKITAVAGSDHPTVTLTQRGAKKIDLQTAAVEKRSTGTAIPYASVLYDADGGQPYVFVNSEGLNFNREDVTIDSIDGDTVTLSSGPAVGTRVVTVGLPQIHGAELEFGAY